MSRFFETVTAIIVKSPHSQFVLGEMGMLIERKRGAKSRRIIPRLLQSMDSGRVNRSDLEALIRRPSPKELPGLIARQIAALRVITRRNLDPKTRAGLLAIIALISHGNEDLDNFFHEIFQVENGNRSQIIFVVVVAMASCGEFELARNFAERIMDDYWTCQAWLSIAAYSGNRKDVEMARRAAMKVHDFRAEGLLVEIRHVSKHSKPRKRQERGFRANLELFGLLARLVESLIFLSGLSGEDGIEELEAARHRLMVDALIAELLAKQINPPINKTGR